ncbi:MAG: helix-turn-helix transcriptional regulator, partial [Clostridia bacterium]
MNELNIQIGKRVRIKREEKKLSRENLAEYLDISPQFLTQIELGKRGMSFTTVSKLCNILSTSADYIILGKQKINDISTFEEMLLNVDSAYLPFIEDIIKTFILAI